MASWTTGPRWLHFFPLRFMVSLRVVCVDVSYWMKHMKTYADTDVCKILIGNKIDMKEKRVCSFWRLFVLFGLAMQSLGISGPPTPLCPKPPHPHPPCERAAVRGPQFEPWYTLERAARRERLGPDSSGRFQRRAGAKRV